MKIIFKNRVTIQCLPRQHMRGYYLPKQQLIDYSQLIPTYPSGRDCSIKDGLSPEKS